MKPEWHYEIDRSQQGPVTQQELARFRADGVIRDETLVWREGMVGWEPYSRTLAGLTEVPPPLRDPRPPACAACGKTAPTDDLISLGGQPVCSACKPLALQRLQEGVGPAPDATTEELRKTHLRHEASFKTVGALYIVSGMFLLLSMLFGAASLRSGSDGSATLSLVIIFFAAVGAGYLWVGFGLRKLRESAREVAIVFAVLGMFAVPLGTVINGYILWLLVSRKGRMICSPAYAQAIRATPHLQYRTPLLAWIALVVIIILIGFIAVGVAGSMRSP